MLKGFRDFLMRGNVVDLAVAVIIGAAFASIVSALNEGVITQLIAAVGGVPDFSRESFDVNGAPIRWGLVLTALLNFLITAAVIYFVVVVPMKRVMDRMKKDADADTPAPTDEAVLLTEIRDLLREQGQRP